MKLRTFVVPVVAFGLLSACGSGSLVSKFKDYQAKGEVVAARGLAEVVVYRCSLMSSDDRKNLANALNRELAGAHRVSALDCNADGAPDFVVDGPE